MDEKNKLFAKLRATNFKDEITNKWIRQFQNGFL